MAVFMLAAARTGAALPAGLAQQMQTLVSRGGTAVVHAADTVLLCHAELGLWPGSGVRTAGHQVAVIAGDPVACVDGHAVGRAASVDLVADCLARGDAPGLRACEGTYSAVAANLATGQVAVAVDKLGVRPVYVAEHEGVLYVASAQWMLEALAALPKQCDWRGAVETAAFGYPLGDRTLYVGMESLTPGTLLRWGPGGRERDCYWDWSRPDTWPAIEDEDPVSRVERAFQRAVDDRLGSDRLGLAFLSGGMDSRYIAARLRERGVSLSTLNFAPEGSADLAFGRLAAQAMGSQHFEFGAGDAPFAQRKTEAIAAWRARQQGPDAEAARQLRVLWSGDGGSVVLGHVYLDESIIDTARKAGLDAAAALIQTRHKYVVPPRMFTHAQRSLAAMPLQGVREGLQQCAAHEPGRACHLFFVLNDQRRHLVGHFETVHEVGHDLHLPFFDARFMAAVLSCPVDLFVGHKLYNRLFERLPFGLGGVPWQAYPGHEPCPVSYAEPLRRQWSDGWFDARTDREQKLRRVSTLWQQLWAASFPASVLSRARMALALQLTRWGLRDYSYLVSSAEPFLRAHRAARG